MTSFCGGLRLRDHNSALGRDNAWRALGNNRELFLDVSTNSWAVHEAHDAIVLVRGMACLVGSGPREVPRAILDHYYQTGQLPIDKLEGSFTLAVLDARSEKVILYRNLVGNGFTYYTRIPGGFLFGSNLAELIALQDQPPEVNLEALPAYFLYRFVPGRQTLFRGWYRLLPGEELVADAHGSRRCQRRTFADLRRTGAEHHDPADRIEATVTDILKGQATIEPGTANLLSGGIDSTYLQAVWNRTVGRPGTSFSVSVDHPLTRQDTAYAWSAARVLGSRHTLVPADEPYIHYLLDSLSATGEPPNHVFAAYFGALARHMAAAGVPVALCGEGADSLFGIGAADMLRRALWVRRLVPSCGLRGCGRRLAGWAGYRYLAEAFRLAEHINQPRHWQHPHNRVAVFTDWDLARAAFGDDAIDAALADRRALVDQVAFGSDPVERLHGVGYLGEAVDSASLWTTLFNRAGGDLVCPFLDSRLLRLAVNWPSALRYPYRRPKGLLKQALARHVPREIVERPKLGFGQPIFEWLAPGGQLRAWVEQIGEYEFIPPAVRASALARPGWLLYSLLCFDLWHKLFIDRTLSHDSLALPAPRSGAQGLPSLGLGMVLS